MKRQWPRWSCEKPPQTCHRHDQRDVLYGGRAHVRGPLRFTNCVGWCHLQPYRGSVCASGADVFSFLIGVQWTKFLILTGEIISRAQGQEIGLVLEEVPRDDMRPRTLDLATRIASMPRFGVMLNKANVDGAAVDMMGGRRISVSLAPIKPW